MKEEIKIGIGGEYKVELSFTDKRLMIHRCSSQSDIRGNEELIMECSHVTGGNIPDLGPGINEGTAKSRSRISCGKHNLINIKRGIVMNIFHFVGKGLSIFSDVLG